MDYFKKMKEIRVEKNLKQNEVARYCGVVSATYQAWESGKNQPDIANLIKLSQYFGVSVDYLLGLTNDDNNYIINSELTETENHLIKLVRMLKSDAQGELITYATYLANKSLPTQGNLVDISGLDELAKADALGYIKGLKNSLKQKRL